MVKKEEETNYLAQIIDHNQKEYEKSIADHFLYSELLDE